MAAKRQDVTQVIEIPASIVRAVAQEPPSPGDFRSRFPQQQPAMAQYVAVSLANQGDVAVEFAERLAAGLWTIYQRALGAELPVMQRDQLEALEPSTRQLLDGLQRARGGGTFDAEWLVDLPREPQPHVMGFLIGALRAARLRLSGSQIFRIATVLLAVAGVLEAASYRFRTGLPVDKGGLAN